MIELPTQERQLPIVHSPLAFRGNNPFRSSCSLTSHAKQTSENQVICIPTHALSDACCARKHVSCRSTFEPRLYAPFKIPVVLRAFCKPIMHASDRGGLKDLRELLSAMSILKASKCAGRSLTSPCMISRASLQPVNSGRSFSVSGSFNKIIRRAGASQTGNAQAQVRHSMKCTLQDPLRCQAVGDSAHDHR